VKITQRVGDTYFARIYLSKVGACLPSAASRALARCIASWPCPSSRKLSRDFIWWKRWCRSSMCREHGCSCERLCVPASDSFLSLFLLLPLSPTAWHYRPGQRGRPSLRRSEPGCARTGVCAFQEAACPRTRLPGRSCPALLLTSLRCHPLTLLSKREHGFCYRRRLACSVCTAAYLPALWLFPAMMLHCPGPHLRGQGHSAQRRCARRV